MKPVLKKCHMPPFVKVEHPSLLFVIKPFDDFVIEQFKELLK